LEYEVSVEISGEIRDLTSFDFSNLRKGKATSRRNSIQDMNMLRISKYTPVCVKLTDKFADQMIN